MSASAGRPDSPGPGGASRTVVPWRMVLSALIVLALLGLLAFTLFLPSQSGRSGPTTAASPAPAPRHPPKANVPSRSSTVTVVQPVPGTRAVHASPHAQVE